MITVHPADVDSVQQMLDTGRLPEAAARLQALRAQYPGSVDVDYLEAVLAYRRGDIELASSGFAAVVRRSPAMYRAWYGLGLVDERAGRVQEAVDAYQRALAIVPSFSPALNRLRQLGVPASPPRVPEPTGGTSAGRPAAVAPVMPMSPVPAIAADLGGIVPFPIRAIRTFLRLALLVPLLGSLAMVILAGWAVLTQMEGTDLGGAFNFGLASFVVFLVTLALFRFVRRLGSVSVTGVASQVAIRQETYGNVRAPGRRYVISLTLHPQDRHRHRFPAIPVELRTKAIHGQLSDGEPVRVQGRPARDGYLAARVIVVSRSGLKFRAGK